MELLSDTITKEMQDSLTYELDEEKTSRSSKGNRSGDKNFRMITRGMIRNEDYRKLFNGPGTVYNYLWANIVRKGWKDQKGYPIREKYYDKRKLLVYCTSLKKLAQDCFMSRKKVTRILKSFEKAGIIKIESLLSKELGRDSKTGKPKIGYGQSIFILGYWDKNAKGECNDYFYINQVFTNRPVQNAQRPCAKRYCTPVQKGTIIVEQL